MAPCVHSYGPSCMLHEELNSFNRKASEVSDDPPKLRPQFFYRSALPIDDPLSPLPAPSLKQSDVAPLPFSTYDNSALEEAWKGLRNSAVTKHKDGDKSQGLFHGYKTSKRGSLYKEFDKDGKIHHGGPFCKDADSKTKEHRLEGSKRHPTDITIIGEEIPEPPTSGSKRDNVTNVFRSLSLFNSIPSSADLLTIREGTGLGKSAPSQVTPTIEPALPSDAKNSDKTFPDVPDPVLEWHKSGLISQPTDLTQPPVELEISCDDPEHILPYSPSPMIGSTKSTNVTGGHVLLCDDSESETTEEQLPVTFQEVNETEVMEDLKEPRHRSIFHRKSHHRKEQGEKSGVNESPKLSRSSSRHRPKSNNTTYGSSPLQRDTTGTPFLRSHLLSHGASPVPDDNADTTFKSEGLRTTSSKPLFSRFNSDNNTDPHKSDSDTASKTIRAAFSHKQKKAYVPVGLSRLHLVEMPDLQMKPIYWSPVHDVSSVIRGTWFYKDTMLPVDLNVANQLEVGYEYMRPWSRTYLDEVNSCLEIGPEAELKIVHKLWPTEQVPGRPNPWNAKVSNISRAEVLTPEEKARKRAADLAASSENKAAGSLEGVEVQTESFRGYSKSSVMYINGRDAQILAPKELPSPAYKRGVLVPMRKGRVVGMAVVRGFDRKAWIKLYPLKNGSINKKAHIAAVASQSGAAATTTMRDACPACLASEERPKVTDLVLVVHGIGQKLSERIESYHFTHAINSFRRQLNIELESDAVQPLLRRDLGGIMVLPVNWRSSLTFEDGGPGPRVAVKHDPSTPKEFTLKDITAETIPAVRNLISDVMLDIPYYLSHHKPKMIQAVIKEANRIYRLWCRNNPGFHEIGKVHLIAHSLGSVMALDILSKQPTKLPKHLDLTDKKPHTNMFEFDTKNLFFCGSPAGFFLLLNHAPLIPRKGRAKAECDGEDLGAGIAGEAGTYGCLAVDNIYNIMHYNDPIAYRINACVDVDYAESLQPAAVPSATNTWAQAFGSIFRGKPTLPTRPNTGIEVLVARPTVGKLPSSLEMETHNFTLEEVAERKMYLLNDNGQIDYFLSSGGGPLEIQYLNMLSAHSRYWVLQDFVRFLVVEIGRKAGKSEAILGMRAVKKVWGK